MITFCPILVFTDGKPESDFPLPSTSKETSSDDPTTKPVHDEEQDNIGKTTFTAERVLDRNVINGVKEI